MGLTRATGTRKLKCSGEADGCVRCRQGGLSCQYSEQKQMGRPRKPRRWSRSSAPVLDYSRFAEETCQDVVQRQDVYARQDLHPSQHVFDSTLSETELLQSFDDGLTNASEWLRNQVADQIQLPESAPIGSLPPALPACGEVSGLVDNENPLRALSPRCQCLSSLYMQFSSFQSLLPISFPYSLAILSTATQTAWNVLSCQACPDRFVSGIQNLMMLTTLLTLVTNEYAKILRHVDHTADQGAAVPFRMGQTEPEMMHLHTGTPDCPMGINIDLDPEVYRKMAKNAVREKVMGNHDTRKESLVTLLEEMQRRQESWHSSRVQQGSLWGRECEKEGNGQGQRRICVDMVGNIRRSIGLLPFG